MTEDPQPTKSAQPTPEQLLKLLDLQIAAQRAKRGDESPHRRMTVLMAALVMILAAAGVALLILQQMVAELPPRTGGNESSMTQPGSQERQF